MKWQRPRGRFRATRIAGAIFVLALTATVLSARPICAQSIDSIAEARLLFRAGMTHAHDGNWDKARAAFERGHALSAQPALLFNLAGAQLRTGRMLAAAANYTRFLHLADNTSIGAVHRSTAQQQLAWIEAHVPRLRISVLGLTEADRLTIDGQRVPLREVELEHWLDPGAHQVRLVRPNGHEVSHRVVLAEAEHRVLPLTLP